MSLLGRWKPLAFASAVIFAAMWAVEILYLRPRAGGIAGIDFRLRPFDAADVLTWLSAVEAAGSQLDVLFWHYLTLDAAFPLVLTLTLASLIVAAGNRLPRFAEKPAWAKSLVALGLTIPFGLADYAQNFVVVRLIGIGSLADPQSLGLAVGLGTAKFALLAVPVVVIATLWLARLRRR